MRSGWSSHLDAARDPTGDVHPVSVHRGGEHAAAARRVQSVSRKGVAGVDLRRWAPSPCGSRLPSADVVPVLRCRDARRADHRRRRL